jgi:hypothetical protein
MINFNISPNLGGLYFASIHELVLLNIDVPLDPAEKASCRWPHVGGPVRLSAATRSEVNEQA